MVDMGFWLSSRKQHRHNMTMRTFLALIIASASLLAQRGNIDIQQIKTTSRKGTGAQLQVFGGGTTTSGHAAVYDAAGNVIDGGGSGGSGSLLIQPPTIFPRYQQPTMPLGLSVTNPVTIANTISATSLIGKTYFGSAQLNPGYWVGRTIRVRATGLYGTTGTPTITVLVKLGGVTVGTLAPGIAGSVSNHGWLFEYFITIASMTSVNASGCFNDVNASGAKIGDCEGSTTTGLDFSTAQSLDITLAWSAADPSNTLTAYVVTVLPLS